MIRHVAKSKVQSVWPFALGLRSPHSAHWLETSMLRVAVGRRIADKGHGAMGEVRSVGQMGGKIGGRNRAEGEKQHGQWPCPPGTATAPA